MSYLGTTGNETGMGALLDAAGRLTLLEGAPGGNVCRPASFLIAVDPATGQVADREGVLNLTGLNATLAVDPSGVFHTAGLSGSPGDPFAVTAKDAAYFGTVMLARVDLARRDEFVPWCAANAASYTQQRRYGGAPFSVAPGEIFSVFGVGLTPAPQLSLGGRPLPVLYAADGQINAAVPYDVPTGNSTLTIARGAYAASYPVEVAAVFPGIFTLDGTHAAVINQDGTVNSAANPAPRGSIIAVYATGLGPLDTAGYPATGFQLFIEADTGSNAAGMEILYAGQAPGLPVGAYQVNARIPAPAKAGEPLLRFAFSAPWFELSQDTVRIFVAP
ncbi:MAG TPA: hypothetical protein VFA33_10330 [Bryobacteraceae bacterium]|nr:hypothetical protein [Bryobacteraceae bacterium]